MNRKTFVSLVLACVLIVGLSGIALGQVPVKTVSVVQPAAGTRIGIGTQVIVQAEALFAADSMQVNLTQEQAAPIDSAVIAYGSADSVKAVNDAKTIWKWWYTIKNGDPEKEVYAAVRFYANGWGDPNLHTAHKFTIDGVRPLADRVQSVTLAASDAKLAIGDTIWITLKVSTTGANELFTSALREAVAYVDTVDAVNPTDSNVSFNLGAAFDAQRELKIPAPGYYVIKEGDLGDLFTIQAHGYVRDNAGNLSATPVKSTATFPFDGVRPTLVRDVGVAKVVAQDSTITADYIFTDGDATTAAENTTEFFFTLSEELDSLIVTLSGTQGTFKDTMTSAMAAPNKPTKAKHTRKGTDFIGSTLASGPLGDIATYNASFWMKDLHGNTKTETISGLRFDGTDPTFSQMFPDSAALATVSYTINDDTKKVQFKLSEPLDSLSVAYWDVDANPDTVEAIVQYAPGNSMLSNLTRQTFFASPVLTDSTKYKLVIYAKDPAGNITADSVGVFYYLKAFTTPVLSAFTVAVKSGYSAGPDFAASTAPDTLLAGDSVTLKVTAMDTVGTDRNVVTFTDQVLIKAVGGTKVTWSGTGVTDQGDGTALLSADPAHWVGGARDVTITNTASDGAITADVDYPVATPAYDGTLTLTWLANHFDRYTLTANPSVVTGAQSFTLTVAPTDKYGNPSIADTTATGVAWRELTKIWTSFSASAPLVALPSGVQEFVKATLTRTYEIPVQAVSVATDVTITAKTESTVPTDGGEKALQATGTAKVTLQPAPVVITAVTLSVTEGTAGVPFNVLITVSETTGAREVALSANKANVTVPPFAMTVDGTALTQVIANVPMSGLQIMASIGGVPKASEAITVVAPTLAAPGSASAEALGGQGTFVKVTFGLSDDNPGKGGNDLAVEYAIVATDSATEAPKYQAVVPALVLGGTGAPDISVGSVVFSTLDDTLPMKYYVWAQNRGINLTSDGISAKVAGKTADGSVVIALTPVDRISAKQIAGVLTSAAVVSNAVRAVDTVAPESVVNLRAKDTPADRGGSITLTWSLSPSDGLVRGLLTDNAGYVMVPGVLQYHVYRKLKGGEFDLIASAKAGQTSYVDAAVAGNGPNYTYAYVVKAVDASNQIASAASREIFASDNVTLPGNWTGSGKVGVQDFLLFARAYGKKTTEVDPTTGVDPMYDLNGDGVINYKDFFLFAASYGKSAAVAKPAPMVLGRNVDATLSLSLLEDAVDAFSVRVSLGEAVELMGYSFTVRYDATTLEFDRAVAGAGNILMSNGSATAPFLVRLEAPGELTIANVLMGGDAVAGQGLAAEIFFTPKDDLGGGQVRVSDGMVVDADLGTNAVMLRSASVAAKPKVFALRQNYPNPFNPVTTIEYALPEAASVRLEVFNTLGQVVATLVNEKQDVGRYSVRWDGLNSNGEAMGSGVYFYRVVAGDFHAIKRMLLIK